MFNNERNNLKKKYIIVTKHAAERLKERNIKLEQVKRAIYEPHITIPAWAKKKRVMRDFGDKCLDVIYKETENSLILVTAVWLTKKERFKNVEDR
ncbi:MAG: DUF4258 domain-containing protein [Candidatus Omnitrophica bacterium]|nr:DUF4258 domain-containing protein [Candidatus Omnitrophota bacterium]MBI5143865.1 DUF4258 domain-containing protein [Candidatus Omnitrophota bacterium]